MPNYEFKCKTCNTHTTKHLGFDHDAQFCGVCNENLTKIYHPNGIIFKGQGFYKTQSRIAKAPSLGGSHA